MYVCDLMLYVADGICQCAAHCPPNYAYVHAVFGIRHYVVIFIAPTTQIVTNDLLPYFSGLATQWEFHGASSISPVSFQSMYFVLYVAFILFYALLLCLPLQFSSDFSHELVRIYFFSRLLPLSDRICCAYVLCCTIIRFFFSVRKLFFCVFCSEHFQFISNGSFIQIHKVFRFLSKCVPFQSREFRLRLRFYYCRSDIERKCMRLRLFANDAATKMKWIWVELERIEDRKIKRFWYHYKINLPTRRD